MTTFVFRLKAPRATFALDMSDEEREIMVRHAEHWRPLIESGQMVIFGPVLDSGGSWGLGVVEADDEETLRAFAADDPVVRPAPARLKSGRCWPASSGHGRRPDDRTLPSVSRPECLLPQADLKGGDAASPARGGS